MHQDTKNASENFNVICLSVAYYFLVFILAKPRTPKAAATAVNQAPMYHSGTDSLSAKNPSYTIGA